MERDMKIETLIFFQKAQLKPTGGPAGYLYNLHKELEKQGYENLSFLENENTINNKNKTKRIKNKMIISMLRFIKYCFINQKKSTVNFDEVKNYTCIHFHSTYDMYINRKWLGTYEGTIVLTSHSPCAFHRELLEKLNYKLLQKQHYLVEKLEKIDEYAFMKADYVIFPCVEAKEPYFSTWSKFKEIDKKIKSKYKYLLTGIQPCQATKSRIEILKENKIPEDAFVVSYVGRHNEIKGYGDLKELALKLWNDGINVYFLIAGREEPIKGLKDDRWIEVGWTKDPHSYIAASDVFVLPNRETYFDLILLEVLSLGKRVLLSYTGGNKHFEQYNLPGIKYFRTLNEAKERIMDYKNEDIYNRIKEEEANYNLYKNLFTSEIFAKNYCKLIREIGEKGGN